MHIQIHRLWIVAIAIVGFQFTACSTTTSSTTPHEKPATVDKDKKTVKLTEKASQRLGIQTVKVSEEQIARKRRLGAEVVGAPAGSSKTGAWARVSINSSDLNAIDRKQLAQVLPIDSDDEDQNGLEAEMDDEREGIASVLTTDTDKYVYYKIKNDSQAPKIGERAQVELRLQASSGARKLIPYSAVIYDVKGATWVYVNFDSLTYQRQPIKIDYIDRDIAYLLDGPASGTSVVTSGVAELYGAETGVGK
jgi:hypothetical protein